MDSGWKLDEKILNIIKESTSEYKSLYSFAFNIDVPKTDDFKQFVYNSKKHFAAVLRNLGVQEPENLFMKLYDNYHNRINKNDTGCSVFRSLFYIVFIVIISDKSKKINTREFPVDINDSDVLLSFLKQTKERIEYDDWHKWYRGQSNFAWDIFPSYYRNINNSGVIKIDYKKLLEDYHDYGLVEKAHHTIGYSNINYDFVSFMQHAVSFSPLLDFTTNPVVATVMGLSDTDNFREHYSNDSSLFELDLHGKEIINEKNQVNKVIANFCVYYSKKFPFLKTLKIAGKDVQISDIEKLVEVLTPKYLLIDIPTNDRMRYQSGKFILFYDCLILDKKVYVELAPGMTITKYKIDKSLKQKGRGKVSCLDKIIKEYPEFSYTNMMDPYGWFGQ